MNDSKDHNHGQTAVSFFAAVKMFFKAWKNGDLENLFSDELTSLPNRKRFLNDYHSFISHAKRHKASSILILVDADNLKIVNDNFGHHSGDFFLKSLGESVKSSCREYDLPTRWGGDEFVLLVEGLRDDDQEGNFKLVDSLVGRILKNWKRIISESRVFNGVVDYADFSYGYCLIDSHSLSEAMKIADEMMYANKRRKKAEK